MNKKIPLDELTFKIYDFNKKHGMSDRELKEAILSVLNSP